MAKSILQRPRPTHSQGRSAKDLYRELNWNQSAGQILPVLCQYVVKGTKGVINSRRFTRSAQVLHPAFDRVTQHLDFFVVPLRYLYTVFNDWQLNINDVNSSLLLGHVSGSVDERLPIPLPQVDFTGLLTKVFPASAFSNDPVKTALACNDALRLIDRLEYGRSAIISTGANVMNLLKLAAYQKVYYDHYRNTSYEANNAYHYNLDWMMDSPLADTTDATTLERLRGLLTLRYVNYRNDFFHNVYPSVNFVSNSIAMDGADWSLPPNLTGVVSPAVYSSSTYQNSVGAKGGSSSTRIFTASGAGSAQNNMVNVEAIRAAFALEKLHRVQSLAPRHVKDQFKAIYGVDVSNKVSFETDRIGSFVNDVVFGEVTATSGGNTGSSTYTQLGDVGGKGVGASGREDDLSFYVDEDSIILGVQYFMPKGFYDSDGMDLFNAYLQREDFPMPMFENLGLRPVYAKALYNSGPASDRNSIIGYTYAWSELKTGIDRNFGLFANTMIKFTKGTTSAPTPNVSSVSGVLSSFVTHVSKMRSIGLSPVPLSADYFKVVPSDLNQIFKQNYSDIGDESTDQFYGWMALKLSVVNGMSLYSLPTF